jgi:sporulation protein YlmC with PRC-barrel domain
MRGCLHMAAAGGLALVALFGPSASAEDAPNAAGAAPDRDTFTMVLDDRRVRPILGKEVVGSDGEKMGRIVDVIVDKSGRPRAAVIDFGGFLGVGSRKIVVDWGALQFDADDGPISLALTRDQVKAAPEYQNGKPVVVVGAISQSVAPDM